jgi:SsrA-binding protein
MQIIAVNKKANHDFLIKEKFDAGIVLTGSEVKSLRINTGSIKESYVLEEKGELWLTNCFIKKYSSSNNDVYHSTRSRKILVNKRELNKIIGLSRKDGMTIIPLLLYFNDKGIAKLSIGLGKGKRKYDKRAAIKSKEWNIKKQRLEKNRHI